MPTNLKYDDDILSTANEPFSYGLDDNESLNVGFCVQYESFSFDPIIIGHILEKSKYEFLESKNFVPTDANLD